MHAHLPDLFSGALALKDIPTDSVSSPQVLQKMMAQITKLMAGSIQFQPVNRMAQPASTTPAETAASAAMWRKAPRMLMSVLRPDANIQAVRPLTAIPMPAMIITVWPAVYSGRLNLKIASHAMAPMTVKRNIALNSAARIEEPRRP